MRSRRHNLSQHCAFCANGGLEVGVFASLSRDEAFVSLLRLEAADKV